jgi:ribosome recycling factor
MIDEVFLSTDTRMQKTIDAMRREFDTIHTGRATPALVDHIKVEAYGTITPINQLANISVPEANLLVIQPWDKNILTSIQKAIQKSDLGINPIPEGSFLRLLVPAPTEERRKEMVKMVRKRVEEGKIGIRNIRRDAMDELRKMERNGDISQDENRRALDRLQKFTDSFIQKADETGRNKESEIMGIGYKEAG